MNYRLTSAILKSVWAIEPRAAAAHGAMIASLLNGEKLEVEITEAPKPFVRSVKGQSSTNFHEAPKGSIAIIPLKGVLMKEDQFCGPVGMQTVGKWIKDADNSDNIDAIVIDADTPGGTADGVETLSATINETKKPTVTHFDGMLCSGGVWGTAPSDLIIAGTEMSQVGSIGVMVSFVDIQPYWEEMGIKFHDIVADQSKDKNKVFLDALKGNYKGIKKEMLNPLAAAFIEHVEKYRPNTSEEQYTGKVFFAKNVKGSLVDDIGNLDYAVERARMLVKPVVKTIKIL